MIILLPIAVLLFLFLSIPVAGWALVTFLPPDTSDNMAGISAMGTGIILALIALIILYIGFRIIDRR